MKATQDRLGNDTVILGNAIPRYLVEAGESEPPPCVIRGNLLILHVENTRILSIRLSAHHRGR